VKRVAAHSISNGFQESSMSFMPLHDRVLVRRIEPEAKTLSGLFIPDSAREKPQEGEIIAVGEGARSKAGELISMSVKAGDRILFGKWSGSEIKLVGEELIIMHECDILGVMA
jgi:chaperonin GroES